MRPIRPAEPPHRTGAPAATSGVALLCSGIGGHHRREEQFLQFRVILREALGFHTAIRWYSSIEITFERHSEEGMAWIDAHFASLATILLRVDKIDLQIDEAVNVIMNRVRVC